MQTVFVPGSHKFGRATLPHETMSLGGDDGGGFKTFPLIGKAGSLALWNGAVWHASVPRHKAGLRVTLVQNYFRTYMRPQSMYDRQLPAAFLDANPELKRLVSGPELTGQLYPYEQTPGDDGPRGTWKGETARIGPFMRSGTDPYA